MPTTVELAQPQTAVPVAAQPENVDDEDAGGNPFAVAKLPIDMRVAFRFKLLFLVWLNSVGIVVIALTVGYLPACKNFIDKGEMRPSFLLVSIMGFLMSLTLLSTAKVRIPRKFLWLNDSCP